MPAKSKAQLHLMQAAAHGAKFSKAKQVRASMTPQQLKDFTRPSSSHLPAHVQASRKMSHA